MTAWTLGLPPPVYVMQGAWLDLVLAVQVVESVLTSM